MPKPVNLLPKGASAQGKLIFRWMPPVPLRTYSHPPFRLIDGQRSAHPQLLSHERSGIVSLKFVREAETVQDLHGALEETICVAGGGSAGSFVKDSHFDVAPRGGQGCHEA